MAVNGNGKERIENLAQNWTSRKKLEKQLRQKRSWKDLKKSRL